VPTRPATRVVARPDVLTIMGAGPGLGSAFDLRPLGVRSVLVYDASVYPAEAALEPTREALGMALDVHVDGALNAKQSSVALMTPDRNGVVVFTVAHPCARAEGGVDGSERRHGAQRNLVLRLDQGLDDRKARLRRESLTHGR